ncbi:MAG TPA: hypothetical protein PKG80_05890 [Acidobacteriota bacterium]|nr:hypothetical protein [Acidobacteriota bacterium]
MTISQPAAARPEGGRGPAWAGRVGRVAAFLLGLVLLYSAWGKALDPAGIGALYARKGVLPAGFATPLIVAVVALEAGLALSYLCGLRHRLVLLVGSLLMGAFCVLTIHEFFSPTKEAASCGCFGNLVVRGPGEAALQDLGFFVLSLAAWLGARGRATLGRWACGFAGGAAGLALALAAPALPVDDWATRLKVGAQVADIQLDQVVPELKDGRRALVLLIDRRDAATKAAVPRINEALALKPGAACAVYGLAEDDAAAAFEFTFSAGPAFEVKSAPYMALKSYYRRLPRAALVEKRAIVRVWNEIPDKAALEALAAGRTP